MEKIYDIVKHRSYPLDKICIDKVMTKKDSLRRISINLHGKIKTGKVIYACKGCFLSPKTKIYDDLPIYVTEKTYKNLKKEKYIL